jgi:hypothetical protein
VIPREGDQCRIQRPRRIDVGVARLRVWIDHEPSQPGRMRTHDRDPKPLALLVLLGKRAATKVRILPVASSR